MSPAPITLITEPSEFAATFQKHSGKKVLIDVREPDETNLGSIQGALFFPSTTIQNRLAEIPRESAVFLYCRSGGRAQRVAQLMADQGWTDLRVAAGYGFEGLKAVM